MLSDNQIIIGTVLLAVLITVVFYIRRAISYKKRMNLIGAGLPESEITLHPEPKEKIPDSEVSWKILLNLSPLFQFKLVMLSN